MSSNSFLAFTGALFSGALALLVALRKRHSIASWCFSAGMALLAIESTLTGISCQMFLPERVAFWQSLTLVTKSLLPGIWLSFSVTYSRGNCRESLAKSRVLLAAAFLLPIALSIGFCSELIGVLPYANSDPAWWISFSTPAKVLNGLLLLSTILILMNLERTFRSAVGIMQWRIKFLVLGVGVVFGTRIYTQTQALLFSGHNLALMGIETGGLLIGCMLMAVGYLRSGFGEIDVYPSRAVLHTSLVVLLAGGYVFVVGVLAQIVAHMGGSRSFQIDTFLVLVGFVVLTVLLLSNRFRQSIRYFISRHFKRPQHDFRKIWTRFTQCTSSVLDQTELCGAAAELISETFDAMSVTVWLLDEHKERLVCAASTSRSPPKASNSSPTPFDVSALVNATRPIDLENARAGWAETLRQISSSQFRKGGNRICIPLRAGEQWLGFAVLVDRVGGVSYTAEELDLLKCIGDQFAASLLNLRLTGELVLAKELEAFQRVSAIFVHDLKNAASTLSLMLQNLPMHFADPDFQEDALRGIRKTVDRIHQLIKSLSALRRELELKPREFDLNLLVDEVMENLNGAPAVELAKQLQPLPKLVADLEQVRSVVTNLLLNAREAVGNEGRITVETSQANGWATLSITDTGCGMSPVFVRSSLFRPFHTTKKRGLGVGMFQSKMIVEAHRGSIQVKSEPGAGTRFEVKLPFKSHAE